MAEKVDIHQRNLTIRKESISTWKTPKANKASFLKFLHEGGLGRVNKGKKLGESTLIKYCDLLKLAFEKVNKDFSKLTVKDMEAFQKWLSSSKYANSTRAKINIQLRVYIRWLLPPEKAELLVGWFDVRTPKKTVDYLSEVEIEKLYDSCKNATERFLIAILFDTGARAEEFHNIRKEDIQLPENGETFVKIILKEEYSKTQGRTISLYWKNTLKAVRDYLSEREDVKNDEAIFEIDYDNARRILKRLGERVLKKSIHYHLFRHSSCTYYASKLNRQELCYRYGWKFSSDMPDVYISRAGMESKQLDEKFKATDLEKMQKEFEAERFETSKRIAALEKELSGDWKARVDKIARENYSRILLEGQREMKAAMKKELECNDCKGGQNELE